MKTARYDEEQLAQLYQAHAEVRTELPNEVGDLLSKSLPRLQSERAREYVQHGVCRRMLVMLRCIENVYSLYPPEQSELLSRDARCDLEISLQAFVSHLLGALDNFAWTQVCESGAENRLRLIDVGLHRAKVLPLYGESFRAYLKSESLTRWLNEYAKNYRDALAHRIPLYVAPCFFTPDDESEYRRLETLVEQSRRDRDYEAVNRLLEQQAEVGQIADVFVHSFSDVEARPIRFHAQVLADARTVVELSREYRGSFESAA